MVDSFESWGNMGPLPGVNAWSQLRPSQLGDTPAIAAGVPLPPHGQTPGTPYINIQAPTESRAVTTQTPPSVGPAKSHKSKSKSPSHRSSVVNGDQKEEVREEAGNVADNVSLFSLLWPQRSVADGKQMCDFLYKRHHLLRRPPVKLALRCQHPPYAHSTPILRLGILLDLSLALRIHVHELDHALSDQHPRYLRVE